MTAAIIPLTRTASEAWDYFASLVADAHADPRLFHDEEHTRRRNAAHRRFTALYMRETGAAA